MATPSTCLHRTVIGWRHIVSLRDTLLTVGVVSPFVDCPVQDGEHNLSAAATASLPCCTQRWMLCATVFRRNKLTTLASVDALWSRVQSSWTNSQTEFRVIFSDLAKSLPTSCTDQRQMTFCCWEGNRSHVRLRTDFSGLTMHYGDVVNLLLPDRQLTTPQLPTNLQTRLNN